MNSSELLTAFREYVDDSVDGTFWTDAELLRFMDEAQRQLVRDAKYLIPDEIILPTVANQAYYVEDSTTLQYRKVRRIADNYPITVYSYQQCESFCPQFLDVARTGRPIVMVIGERKGFFRLAPTPSAVENIRILVYRLPILSITGLAQNLEIDEEHHPYLLHWMAYRALRKHDGEVFDKAKADEELALFKAYARDARREREQLDHSPKQVVYGGLSFTDQ